jgi:1,6-anhydro-N-acetylmuramate kinase
MLDGRDIAPADVQATLVALTARTVADASGEALRRRHRSVGRRRRREEPQALMEALAAALAPRRVTTTAVMA